MGACIQAASVLHDADPIDVVQSWQQDTASLVPPNPHVDHEEIRAAYTAARG